MNKLDVIDTEEMDVDEMDSCVGSCYWRPIEEEKTMYSENVECYDVGECHFEIWRQYNPKAYRLISCFQSADGTRPVDAVEETFASVASARRAMYKHAWDFASKKRVLPYAVL